MSLLFVIFLLFDHEIYRSLDITYDDEGMSVAADTYYTQDLGSFLLFSVFVLSAIQFIVSIISLFTPIMRKWGFVALVTSLLFGVPAWVLMVLSSTG